MWESGRRAKDCLWPQGSLLRGGTAASRLGLSHPRGNASPPRFPQLVVDNPRCARKLRVGRALPCWQSLESCSPASRAVRPIERFLEVSDYLALGEHRATRRVLGQLGLSLGHRRFRVRSVSIPGVARWSVGRVRSVAPFQGTDADKAYAIHFAESDHAEPQITVEYASGGGGKYASHAHARKAVEPYLDLESPPRRLVVSRHGEISPRE